MLERLRPASSKEIPFIIFFSFLATYVVARLFVYLFPSIFLYVRGVHIHHFAYGIIILTVVGFYDLVVRPAGRALHITAVAFGIGLALAYDEFGMWLRLRDRNVSRFDYDAILIIVLILLNIIYFSDFWRETGHRLFLRIFKNGTTT
jgi:glucan phosphoethanolaminetransferase (alkaline phosphatase superfamily)